MTKHNEEFLRDKLQTLVGGYYEYTANAGTVKEKKIRMQVRDVTLVEETDSSSVAKVRGKIVNGRGYYICKASNFDKRAIAIKIS